MGTLAAQGPAGALNMLELATGCWGSAFTIAATTRKLCGPGLTPSKASSALRRLVQRIGRVGYRVRWFRRCRPGFGLRAGQVQRTLLTAAGARHTQGDQDRAASDTDMGERSA